MHNRHPTCLHQFLLSSDCECGSNCNTPRGDPVQSGPVQPYVAWQKQPHSSAQLGKEILLPHSVSAVLGQNTVGLHADEENLKLCRLSEITFMSRNFSASDCNSFARRYTICIYVWAESAVN